MNRRYSLVILIIAILLMAILYTFSIPDPSEKECEFFGTWESEDNFFTYVFYKNMTCSINDEDFGTWKINNGEISISLRDGREIYNNEYFFSEDYKTLNLGGLILYKQ